MKKIIVTLALACIFISACMFEQTPEEKCFNPSYKSQVTGWPWKYKNGVACSVRSCCNYIRYLCNEKTACNGDRACNYDNLKRIL